MKTKLGILMAATLVFAAILTGCASTSASPSASAASASAASAASASAASAASPSAASAASAAEASAAALAASAASASSAPASASASASAASASAASEAEASTATSVIPGEYAGIDVESPEWVANLDAAKSADQMLVVAAFAEDATDAWVSLHEKQADGTWHMVMTTPGFIGKKGLNKTKEGDAKTPTGVFHFNRAFGIADDPGCAIPYVKVDNDTYWSGDPEPGHHYNELVTTKDVPELDLESGDSEHIIDYPYHYQYCLNISYNEEGTPGLGSAIFLHCLGPAKPFTGGCVAIPEEHMKYVMTQVDETTAVVIDTYEKLSGSTDWPDSTWPQER